MATCTGLGKASREPTAASAPVRELGGGRRLRPVSPRLLPPWAHASARRQADPSDGHGRAVASGLTQCEDGGAWETQMQRGDCHAVCSVLGGRRAAGRLPKPAPGPAMPAPLGGT